MLMLRLKSKELKMFSPTFFGGNGTSALWSHGQDFTEKRWKGAEDTESGPGLMMSPGHVSPGRSDSRKQAGGHRKCLGNFSEQLKPLRE